MEYTLADLARVTGAKPRSLQLWADGGLIAPHKSTDRGGSGTHRRFSRKEAIIACILRAFALHQVAIGELSDISHILRGFIHGVRPNEKDFFTRIVVSEGWKRYGSWPGKKKEDPALPKILEDAVKGKGEGTFVYETWNEHGVRMYGGGFFPTAQVKFEHLDKPEGFAAVVLLRTYLSKIDD